MSDIAIDKIIASILKHDNKINTYKIALIRSINDVVLSYPDMMTHDRDVAIPLHRLARYWVAYYWPFVDSRNPIFQGPRSLRNGIVTNDMAFRPALTQLREAWESLHRDMQSNPADGYLVMDELSVPYKRDRYRKSFPKLVRAYDNAIMAISKAIEQPTRYAGTNIEGEFAVFRPHAPLKDLNLVVALPGTSPQDTCIVVPAEIWNQFRLQSLWIEALSIYEWSIFVEHKLNGVSRSDIFTLLTARPDNRVPLDWERNQVLVLMEEGRQFECVWTHRPIRSGDAFDLDHLIPVSVYPINEVWNLVPTHPSANRSKSDKIPSIDLLERAVRPLSQTYQLYTGSADLRRALVDETRLRFSTELSQRDFEQDLAHRVIRFMDYIAEARSLGRVERFG